MKALFRPPMDKLVETLGITSLSKSQVSVMAKELDVAVEAFRTWPLDAGPYTFMAADALVLKVREAGRVVNVHALIATATNESRARHPRPRHRSEKDKEHDDTQAARLVRRPAGLEGTTLLGRSRLDTASSANEHDSGKAPPHPSGTATAPAADVAANVAAATTTAPTAACRRDDPLGSVSTPRREGSTVLVRTVPATQNPLCRCGNSGYRVCLCVRREPVPLRGTADVLRAWGNPDVVRARGKPHVLRVRVRRIRVPRYRQVLSVLPNGPEERHGRLCGGPCVRGRISRW